MRRLVAALSVFVPHFASAQGEDSAFWPASYMGHNESSRCVSSDDPFDVPAYVFAKKFQLPPNVLQLSFPNTDHPADEGRCVSRNHYRPVLRLSETGQKAFQMFDDKEHLVVANVRHFDKFYVASIPVKKVTAMNFMISIRKMPFMGTRGSHVEMRIFFSEPVRLVPQWPLDELGAFSVDELVFTGNPTGGGEEDRYAIMKNFDGSLLHARGIHTSLTRLKDSFVDFQTDTEKQYRMRMNGKEAEDYIRYYVALADTQRLGRHFLLTALNCSFTQFEVLDKVLAHRYTASKYPYDPEFALRALSQRGLVDQIVQLLPFEQEEQSRVFFSEFPRKED